jgi:hypothetical protein
MESLTALLSQNQLPLQYQPSNDPVFDSAELCEESTKNLTKEIQKSQKLISQFMFFGYDDKHSNYRELKPVLNLPVKLHASSTQNPQLYDVIH